MSVFLRSGLLPSGKASRSLAAGLSVRPSQTMRAAVLSEIGSKDRPFRMDIETLPIPRPKANEVLLRTRACGVCHTDLHVILGHIGFPSPCIMGHEVSGEVVELGPGTDAHVAKRVPIGAKAVVPFIMPCGSCGFCARGKEDICETFFEYNRLKGTLYDGQTRVFRNDGTPIHMYSMGGLAEYCVAPATAVFPISDAIPFAEASIIGCAVFTAYGAMRNAAELQAGENVAVLGTGGVGANCLQIARAFGADRIIAVDVTDDKLAAMRALGATDTINASRENVADRIREVTRGRGVDVCVEALGNPKTFATAVNAVCDGGRAVMVGIAPAGTMAPVEITRIVRREIQIRGSYGARARTDVPAILRLIEKGQVDIVKPITQRFALDQAVRAYTELDAGRIVGRAIIDMKL